jgi:hypothetical protein
MFVRVTCINPLVLYATTTQRKHSSAVPGACQQCCTNFEKNYDKLCSWRFRPAVRSGLRRVLLRGVARSVKMAAGDRSHGIGGLWRI